MRVDGELLILEGPECKAYEMLFMRLVENLGVKTAMEQTWPLFPAMSSDSRGAVVNAALRTLGSYMLVRHLRPDMDNLTVFESAREAAKIALERDGDPSQGDRAVKGGKIPSEQDKKIVAVTGTVAQMTATVRPAGTFRKALGLQRTLSDH